MPRSFRTGDQALVRELNRAIMLNLLRTDAQSRAGLAAASGLNKTTVSSLITELLSAGLVRETGTAESGGGRPGTLLELNPRAGGMIGVELGVEYLRVVLADFCAVPVWHQELAFDHCQGPTVALEALVVLVGAAVAAARQSGQPILGLGLAAPGLVDIDSGTLLFGPNLGWRDVPLRRRLEQAFSFPIFVDNDAKASALGERYFGIAQSVDNFVFVLANVGLGCGIMLDGDVHRGATGSAGEVGHTTLLLPDGPLCECGNRGCWETVASQRALLNRLEGRLPRALGGSPPPDRYGSMGMETVVAAAEGGDEYVLAALAETGHYLGVGIANLVNIFNPSLVVVGGALSLAADFLLPPIRQAVAERAMAWPRQAAQIQVAAHRFDSVAMGGVALVLHDILSHPHLDLPRSAIRPRQKGEAV
jgi:predicted NBD/HSP70 family sugar kinase